VVLQILVRPPTATNQNEFPEGKHHLEGSKKKHLPFRIVPQGLSDLNADLQR